MNNRELEINTKRLSELKELLAKYDQQYYIQDDPTVDDAVYDGLKAELKNIEAKYPELITADSPSQRVVGEVSEGFKSVVHRTRMLSLNDVFDISEIDAWINRIRKLAPSANEINYFADVKKDGLACALVYEDGALQQAITRGDGYTGEDVTANVKTIRSVPLSLSKSDGNKSLINGRLEVRGEIVMYRKDFEELNKERASSGLSLYANPRNTAAGTIRQLDSGLVAKRKLHFLAYDIIQEGKSTIVSHSELYKLIADMGFKGYEHASSLHDVKSIHKYISEWENKRDSLPYNIDGLVIKVDNRKLYSDLGIVGKTPRGAIAYKFPAEQATTTVKDIFISIGRTGSATPVAILAPVVVDGSTVQMATLHNESEIHRKDIRVGDTVVIRKAGDIIPEVIEPLTDLRPKNSTIFKMPTECPDCGTKLIKIKQDDAAWRCPNTKCPARNQRHIEHFASKTALDIEGLGEKNVEVLRQNGLISDQADIYKLQKEDLLELDRFAEVSANKLIAAIADKKQPELPRFLFGLGIRHVGIQTAIDLANNFNSLEKLSKADYEQLAGIDGVGEVVAESIVAWFSDPQNVKLLEKFKKYGVWPKKQIKKEGALSGKRFVVTGSLEQMSRTLAADRIRDKGGIFQSSLGKDTDYLVVGQKVGASKLKKAEEYGTKRLSESEFMKLIS